MQTWIGFLRAVNVGKRKYLMADLRAAMSAAGFTDVETHIQTGNVRFSTPLTDREEVSAQVESVLLADRGFEVPVVLLTPEELRSLAVEGLGLGADLEPDAHYIAVAAAEVSVMVGGATSVTAGTGVATKTVTGGATLGAAGVRASTTSVPGTNVDFTLTLFPAVVQVGDNFFRSLRNSSQDAAVDTVQVGQQVRWTVTGSASHTVESTGTPTFTSSGNLGKGSTYTITFGSAGTYTFDCAIHGAAQMSGRIVVVP